MFSIRLIWWIGKIYIIESLDINICNDVNFYKICQNSKKKNSVILEHYNFRILKQFFLLYNYKNFLFLKNFKTLRNK